jgi:hypothetical protein
MKFAGNCPTVRKTHVRIFQKQIDNRKCRHILRHSAEFDEKRITLLSNFRGLNLEWCWNGLGLSVWHDVCQWGRCAMTAESFLDQILF